MSRVEALTAALRHAPAYFEHKTRKVGMSSWLARAVDVGAIGAGVWLLVTAGLVVQAVGVLLVLGGVFGFLYEPGGQAA